MRTKLLLIVFIISTFAFSANANDSITQIKIENLQRKIDTLKLDNKNLQKENENLKKGIEIIKAKSESTSIMIDKVDSMYQNNFDRLAIIFTFIGGVITIVLPYYLKTEQQKIIELKEKELNASNEEKIKEVLKDFNDKLTESEKKYKEDLDKETENLNNTISEKTKKLEQKITKSNYSLSSKIYILTASQLKKNEDYNNFTNAFIHYLYNDYKAENSNLQEIIKLSNTLIKEIEDKNVLITKGSYSHIIYFINEYDLKQKELNLDKINPFEKLKSIVKEQ